MEADTAMTRKERMFAAIRRQPVDRVPHATYNFHPYTDNEHTRDPSYAELLEKVRLTAGVAAKLGFGAVDVALSRPREGVVEVRVTGTGDDRIRTTVVHTPKGDLTSIERVPEHKPGRVIKPLIGTDEDADKFMSLPYEPPEFDATRLRQFDRAAGDRAVMLVMFQEPMYSIASRMHFEDFCIRCITALPQVKRMVDWAFERCANNLRRMTEACRGLECVFHTGGPEVCTPPMLAPRFFAELVAPYLKKLNRMIHDAGFLAGVHCHGRVREVLPHIMEADVDLLEPIEPPDQGNITLEELMEQAEGRMCLMGHIQDQEFYTAPPGHFTRRVEEIARVVRGRTGYIMSPTCTTFDHPCTETYRRNYMEWLEACEKLLKA